MSLENFIEETEIEIEEADIKKGSLTEYLFLCKMQELAKALKDELEQS